MQYFKPPDPYFAGDCMPFAHDGVFHLFYLLDENHHQGRGGLGGHQWAHASTTDLIHWQHHPLALPIQEDWEGSICTGSVIFAGGYYHAFYATRKPDFTQHLSHAISQDGITFEKCSPNPFMPAPEGYSPSDFRDPFVFQDDSGRYQMLVTSKMNHYPLYERGGCLLRLSSDDLVRWSVEEPFLVPGSGPGFLGVPECPDYFYWEGWFYLLFGLGLQTRYRMSRSPFGPWQKPANDLLDCPSLAVIKTASFGSDRRIGAGWLPCRKGDRDAGDRLWGGNVVFREILRQEDGALSTCFPAEMEPSAPGPVNYTIRRLTPGAPIPGTCLYLDASREPAAAAIENLPLNFRLRCRVLSGGETAQFGLGLRGSGDLQNAYELLFDPGLRMVSLAGETLQGVDGMDGFFELEIVFRSDILDLCIAGQRCLTTRLYELQGSSLFFFCLNGRVTYDEIELSI
jgi:beta-fructofuranosidase